MAAFLFPAERDTMCLILLAWQAHPDYPLVVAANRDEYFSRPTREAAYWPDHPAVLAGRDLAGGGTWLGISRAGRFAALTNYRDPANQNPAAPSRGALVSDFLAGHQSPGQYLAEVTGRADTYNGYNLLVGDGRELCWQSNRGSLGRDASAMLAPGIHGLSNHLLNTAWPKVARGKSRLARALESLPDDGKLLDLLRDDVVHEDSLLPRTGVSLEWERLLSAAFVRSSSYGTRSSTIILQDRQGNTRFEEVRYGPDGGETGRSLFEFETGG